MVEMNRSIDVIGFGNSLLDILVFVDEEFLKKIGFEKGGMYLVSEEVLQDVLKNFSDSELNVCAGGSCANTVFGVSYLGGRSCFCGVVGKDDFADRYEESLKSDLLLTRLSRVSERTGHVVALITPDSERTMLVHLGASIRFKAEHFDERDLRDSKVFHIEAYQLEGFESKKAILEAVGVARESGVLISMDLSDYGLVERNLEFFREFVYEFVDIVFANEDEALAFTGVSNEREALDFLAELCEVAVVKVGSRGSLIKSGEEVFEIPVVEVDAVDTTGAGDNYAAGVLFGITNGLSLEEAGRLASSHAAKVVSQVGARLID